MSFMLGNQRFPNPKFKWARPPPRVLVVAEAASFDKKTFQALQTEGFQISYLRYDGDRKKFGEQIHRVAKPMELGDHWGILAFGRAATAALDVCMRPVEKLDALITYYPTAFPATTTNLPPNLASVVHLAGDQKLGTPKYPSYNYPHAKTGFAETNSEHFDQVASDLAWTRTLCALRTGFGFGTELESIWEKHLSGTSEARFPPPEGIADLEKAEFMQRDVEATLDGMVDDSSVNFVPTMSGGVGTTELRKFYEEYFIGKSPASMRMRLISRTIGTDRVVDEMVLSFTHDAEIPWMLPGVKPTNKKIEVGMVMIICIRGKKIYQEHIYWDQASVLVQAGLIDGKRLPVVGAECAQKLLGASDTPYNPLINRRKRNQNSSKK